MDIFRGRPLLLEALATSSYEITGTISSYKIFDLPSSCKVFGVKSSYEVFGVTSLYKSIILAIIICEYMQYCKY